MEIEVGFLAANVNIYDEKRNFRVFHTDAIFYTSVFTLAMKEECHFDAFLNKFLCFDTTFKCILCMTAFSKTSFVLCSMY